jgi:hypothetical protein
LPNPAGEPAAAPKYRRLPFDTRCAAKTKKGRRCRAKIRPGTDHCAFHDPTLTDERRRRNAAKGGRARNRLANLPDGYLRKLKTRADVGHCMDRLYREVRLGIISKEMGTVLFNILCRLLDTGLVKQPSPKPISKGRTKVNRIRPKLNDLLTSTERTAWNQAIANASKDQSKSSRIRPPPPRRTHRTACLRVWGVLLCMPLWRKRDPALALGALMRLVFDIMSDTPETGR